MAKLEPQVLVEIAGCVAQIKQAVEKYPSLRVLINELMSNGERVRETRTTPTRPRRKMTAAQLKANSIRMKKRWREAKKAGRMKL